MFISFTFIVNSYCGGETGYVVTYEGGDPNGNKTNETHFTFDLRPGSSVDWTLQSYVGNKRSDKVTNSTTLCHFKPPELPKPHKTTNGEIIIPDGTYEFIWSNPVGSIQEMCGERLTYSYEVSVTPLNGTEKPTNVSDTNYTKSLGSGNYTWKVRTSNGVLVSGWSEENMTFCVPKELS